MSKDKLDELKARNISGANPGSILAKLWRNVIHDLGIENKMSYLITRYLDRAKRTTVDSKSKSKITRTRVLNNVISHDITWKVFLDNIVNLLNVKELTITVTLKHQNDTETTHSVKVKNLKGVIDADNTKDV